MTNRIPLIMISLCLVSVPLAAAVWAQEKSGLFQEGQKVFTSHCAACHRSNGEGLPDVFPALNGNPFVMGDPTPVIQTILEGRKGKIGRMPSWRDTLSDQQIAGVATYIRQHWGNQAEAVTVDLVAKNRKK